MEVGKNHKHTVISVISAFLGIVMFNNKKAMFYYYVVAIVNIFQEGENVMKKIVRVRKGRETVKERVFLKIVFFNTVNLNLFCDFTS